MKGNIERYKERVTVKKEKVTREEKSSKVQRYSNKRVGVRQ